MHTIETKSCRIHYNSDLSGDVILTSENSEARVDGDAILALVARCLPMMSEDARNNFFINIETKLCRHCHSVTDGRPCYCMRDD